MANKKHTFTIHPQAIKQFCTDRNTIKALALFCYYKSHFNNSTIYRYSIRKIMAEHKLSYTVATRIVSILKENGFAIERDGNITFISTRKLYSDGKIFYKDGFKKIKIKRREKLSSIVDYLYTSFIEDVFDQQKYVIGIKQELSFLKNSQEEGQLGKINYLRLKKVLKLANRPGFQGNCDKDTTITSRQLGKKLGVSHSSANTILNRLHRKRLIKKKSKIEMICDFSGGKIDDQMREGIKGYLFIHKGNLYLHKGTSVSYFANRIYSRFPDSKFGVKDSSINSNSSISSNSNSNSNSSLNSKCGTRCIGNIIEDSNRL